MDDITIGLAQIAPVWLKRKETIQKIIKYIQRAAGRNCQLVVFGETLLPGYPFWIENTNGAKFNSSIQKEIYSHYLQQAVQIENGDLGPVCEVAKNNNIAVAMGCVERAKDRGGHSVYCTMVYINQQGEINNTHRKVMPTYEERLCWSQGDGHGLRVQKLGSFTVGGLNCWENWMPLMRSALYGLGEDLHIAIWPGSVRNTKDITRFIAMESRSFVISVSGLMKRSDIPNDIPHSQFILKNCPEVMANGGSCVAGPDGEWVLEPQKDTEDLFIVTINHEKVRQERQNFDPAGHYSRPDITELSINRKRQSTLNILDD